MKKTMVVSALVAVALAAVGGVLAAVGMLPMPALFGFESSSRNTQVIKSVERAEEIVLLRLGIQGISEKNEAGKFMNRKVPGSERAAFIQYEFNAKLGIDGKDVKVDETGENEFTVSIPKFIFIGHSDEQFRLVNQSSGILSFATPKIDTIGMINEILNPDAQEEYVSRNEDILKDQAQYFYGNIIKSVDPSVTVKFVFAGDDA